MRLTKRKKKTDTANDVATSDTVVEGVMDLMMGTLNPRCYSDISGDFSGCHMAKEYIPPTWILIDSQLTLNLFNNMELLTGIKTVANK